jgi:3-demethoxyubiquinol 3-hydroxylase
MQQRDFGLLDRFLGGIDRAIKTLSVHGAARREVPGAAAATPLEEKARQESIRLMRVNHAGEVAAQALYQGQALTARRPAVANALQHAAVEEADHLAWCQQRLDELKGRASLLNPLWYAGSFALGAVAGLAGDAVSLGFVAETEHQVEAHLRTHLKRLSPADARSRAIVEQMTHDEMQHGGMASALGGRTLPSGVQWAMRTSAKVMTRTSYWL